MIPARAELEELGSLYSKQELDVLEKAGARISAYDPEKAQLIGHQFVRTLWPDQLERIAKTHRISTKSDGIRPLIANYAQRRFYTEVILASRKEGVPIRGIICKARQLGFSTFVQAWHYDEVETSPHRNCMTISYDDESSMEMFEKAKVIHANLWFPRPLSRNRGAVVQFAEPHSSNFYIKTAGNRSAGRSYTTHNLHLSEIPMWSSAEEVLEGSLQMVPAKLPTSSVIMESTAKGAEGPFYETWRRAVKSEKDGYLPFFAPWFWDPEYVREFPSDDHRRRFMRSLSGADTEYMRRHSLSPDQMNWRAWKIQWDLNGNERKFRQEFPANAEEAFLTTGAPVFSPDTVNAMIANTKTPVWTGEIGLTYA